MTDRDTIEKIGRWQSKALMAGVIGIALSAVIAMKDTEAFLQAYHVAFLFWLGVSAGSLAWLMIHHLAGGRWGFVARRVFEASAKTLPLMLLFGLPIVLKGMDAIFPWMTEHDPILDAKSIYLNERFFIERGAMYFVIWIGLAWLLTRWSKRQDETGDITLNRPMRMLSGVGIVLYALAATFASFDWMMSLDPHWFSSMMGPLFMISQGLAAMTVAIVVLHALSGEHPFAELKLAKPFHDLGNLTFAFVIFWTYMSFSQYIIIWSGNLPEEITWYLARSSKHWVLVAIVLALFHFGVPFFVLLSRHSKRKSGWLVKVALWLILMRFVDLVWWVTPTFEHHGHGHFDLLAHVAFVAVSAVGIGGIWVAFFAWRLKAVALLPQHDPRFVAEEESGHA